MEDMTANYLSKLLNREDISNEYLNQIKVALYLTLLSLNNNNYNEKIYNDEMNAIDDYLRKMNNLKVKIQLKRKPEEIDKLLNEIKELTVNNQKIIRNYNKNNLNIINILDTKDPKEITILIDKLTKVKINKHENKDYYNKLRENILNNVYYNNHYIIDNTLYIGNDLVINLEEFYHIFDYLLDSNNYQDIYQDKTKNDLHKNIINNLIEVVENGKKLNDEAIPVALTSLITNKLFDSEDIDTSKFNIDNIKITDLYSFAYNNNQNEKTAKWKNIAIPNYYLYNKIKEITKKGMYYFKDNKFILEIINDFKISINIQDMYQFLNDNLNNQLQVKEYQKHI